MLHARGRTLVRRHERPWAGHVWSARVEGIWLEGAPDASGGGDYGWMISPVAIAPEHVELVATDIPAGR